jgi:hypothetical protein
MEWQGQLKRAAVVVEGRQGFELSTVGQALASAWALAPVLTGRSSEQEPAWEPLELQLHALLLRGPGLGLGQGLGLGSGLRPELGVVCL